MGSTRCILATIKIVQLGMGIACLALREKAHRNPEVPKMHNTIFCGTFMGFTLIALALLFGYCVRKPAPKEVDLLFGFVGGMCFFICGTLSMHYPMIDNKQIKLSPQEKETDAFFQLCSNIALTCFTNALLYIFEACMLYDIWYDDRKQENRPPTEEDKEEPDSDTLGRLTLRCVCVELVWERIRHCRRRHQQQTPGILPTSSGLSTPPQPGPSSASTGGIQPLPSATSMGTTLRQKEQLIHRSYADFEEIYIPLKPPTGKEDTGSKY